MKPRLALPIRDAVVRKRFVQPDEMDRELTALMVEAVRHRAICIGIQNVADYLMGGTSQEHWDFEKDFPNVAPPWPEMWFEWDLPTVWSSDDFPSYEHKIGVSKEEFAQVLASRAFRELGVRFGVLLGAVDASMLPDPPPDGMPPRHPEARWNMAAAVWYRESGVVYGPTSRLDVQVRATGVAIGDTGIVQVPESIANPQYAAGLDPVKVASPNYFPPLLALSFLHCRNVVRVEQRPNRAEVRRAERMGLPTITAYTLDIAPIKKIVDETAKREGVSVQKALHIVRGHFATYTEDKPLFGRSVGTFWKPMHTRGSIKHGAIEKDYEVTTG